MQFEARYGESVKVLTHTKEYKIRKTNMKRNIYLMNTMANKNYIGQEEAAQAEGERGGGEDGEQEGRRGSSGAGGEQEQEEGRRREEEERRGLDRRREVDRRRELAAEPSSGGTAIVEVVRPRLVYKILHRN